MQVAKGVRTFKEEEVSKRGTSYAIDDATVIGNLHMNLVQSIISTPLYSSYASKQVHCMKMTQLEIDVNRLNFVRLCC